MFPNILCIITYELAKTCFLEKKSLAVFITQTLEDYIQILLSNKIDHKGVILNSVIILQPVEDKIKYFEKCLWFGVS